MNQQSPKGPRRKWPWFVAAAAALLVSCIIILLSLVARYDLNRLKPLAAGLVSQMTGRTVLIHGPIKLETDLTPCLVVEGVSLQNAPWGTFQNMAEAKRVEMEIALFPLLRNEIHIKKVILIEPKFMIEKDRSGKSNLRFQSDSKIPTSEGHRITLEKMVIERGLFSYRDGKTGKSFSAFIKRLEARRTKPGDRIELETAGTTDSGSFELKGRVGSVTLPITPENPLRIDLALKAFGTEVLLNGFVRHFKSPEGVALKVQAEGASIGGIAEAFGLGHVPELGPFKIECDLSGEKDETWSFSGLKFSTRAGGGQGELWIRLSGPRPEVRGRLACHKLDIRCLFSKGATNAAGKEKKEKIFPSEPLPLSNLTRMTGKVEITAEEIAFPHLVLNGLKTQIQAAKGRFAAKPLRLIAGGGETEGSVEVMQGGGVATLTAQARINQADLNLLLEGKTQGEADAEIEVTSQGVSVADLMGNLNGRALLAVRGLRIDNKYLKLLGSDFITKLSCIFAPEDANATEINCLVSGFEITDGIAQVTAMVADTKDMVVVGGGRLDLKKERPDLTITPYSKMGLVGLSLSLNELMRVFRLRGTFSAPSLEIDALRTGLTIGKAVGGVLLLGPAGAALAFAGQSAGDGDVCTTAMETARKGGRKSEGRTEEEQSSNAGGETSGGIHSVLDFLGKFFKHPSGRPVTPVDVYSGP